MTVNDALQAAGIDRADAEVLLSALLSHDRTWLHAHSEEEIEQALLVRWNEWCVRRRKREPVAYIIGETEFFGRPFFIDHRALIPRPSTETLVETTLDFLTNPRNDERDADTDIIIWSKRLRGGSPELIVDVGTGSGCIAVTLALETTLPIIATDISADALALATKNAERHGVGERATFKKGDGIDPIKDVSVPFLLVSNPPYIKARMHLMKDVQDYEPHVALFGGEDGCSLLRPVVKWAKKNEHCVGFVVECHTKQMALLRAVSSF